MISFSTKLRVQYCDTDQMSFAHHSNYVKYFELARLELLRNIGVSYASIEEAGFIMPVVDVKIHYIKPAFYDDELLIETRLPALKGARVVFSYHVTNQEGKLICEGETTLAFAGKVSKRACHPPSFFINAVHDAEVAV
ncbi:acyl-CoA thioesterase [Arcticibacter tournemirensis]|uniref:Acyl-CoA thioesterase n=1 Tax=Arcticibacter tournemirensis TaxID=699437 RepID=A0A4Q0MCK8_9SPHI|nr:thioesterase family protein [Arcticibacter tournemirensis]RXF70639.1 acyl-CoA thioesterase [Arcticibacter tournemirensis]